MRTTRSARCALPVIVAALLPCLGAGDEPAPKPTPRPSTLSEIAGTIVLDRSVLDSEDGGVVISDHNLDRLARQGRLTTCTLPGGPQRPTPRAETRTSGGSRHGDEATRRRWRDAYREQADRISSLEGKRALIELEIGQLWRAEPTPRNLARLERARAKLEHLEEDIAREQARLDAVVREARRHGAQPGWFRGLGGS